MRPLSPHRHSREACPRENGERESRGWKLVLEKAGSRNTVKERGQEIYRHSQPTYRHSREACPRENGERESSQQTARPQNRVRS